MWVPDNRMLRKGRRVPKRGRRPKTIMGHGQEIQNKSTIRESSEFT